MNGIALQVEDEHLDLGDAKIRLRIQSPLLQPEFVRQSYSYPFTLPYTPKNARLFGHADRLANVRNIIELETHVYLGGLYWRTGTLRYRRYRNGFDCDLIVPPDTVVTTLGDTSLQDVDLGEMDTTAELLSSDYAGLDDIYSAYNAPYGTEKWVFAPIKNARPLGDGHWFDWPTNQPGVPDPAPEGYVNHYDATATYKWFQHQALPADELYHVLTPCPFLRSVVEAVFALAGVRFSSSLLQEDEFMRMVVVGNLLQTVGFTIIGGSVTSLVQDHAIMNPALGLPNMTCIEFLVALQKRFNGRFIFSPQGVRFVTMVEVLNSYDIFDATELAVPEQEFELNNGNGYNLDEVEDSMDALGQDRNDAKLDIILHEVNAVADLAGLSPDDGDIALVLASSQLWKYNLSSGAGWEFHKPYLVGVTNGNAAQDLDVGVAMTRMYCGADDYLGTRSWLTPEVEMKLSEREPDTHGVGRSDLSVLRLLFYRGMQEDSLGDTYPLLTNGTMDYAGAVITGAEWCERIDGDGGIHQLWYEGPLRTMSQAKAVQRRVRLPLAQVMRYDFTQKMQIDSINYLVDAIDVEFTVATMGVPRLDLVKV